MNFYATKSRLMGVVGLILEDQETSYLLHLDFESYGLDRVEEVEKEEPFLYDLLQDDVMGGLGGELIAINRPEASYLFHSALAKGTAVQEETLENLERLLGSYEDQDKETCLRKLCPLPLESYERCHYALMRVLGGDIKELTALLGISTYPDFPGQVTLIRNSLHEEAYGLSFEGIYQEENLYHLVIGRFIQSALGDDLVFDQDQVISVKEVALNLRQDEFLGEYVIIDDDGLRKKILEDLRHKMAIQHEQGILYTIFYPHNHHVKKRVYRLSGDVAVTLFLMEEKVLIASTQHEQVTYLANQLMPYLEAKAHYHFDNPILYDFVLSGAEDFSLDE